MKNSNNPPEVIIELSQDDAQTLLDDCDSAIHQLLMTIQENADDGRTVFLERLCKLMEFKRRVKHAVEKGLNQ